MESKRHGFMIDNFLVTFPDEKDFIEENEDGTMAIIVDIYKVEADKQIPVDQSEITPELEEKIGAFVNNMLTEAIEKAEKSSKKATAG